LCEIELKMHHEKSEDLINGVSYSGQRTTDEKWNVKSEKCQWKKVLEINDIVGISARQDN